MIANKLNVLLAERQLTIKDAVEGTGLSRNTISNLINKNMTNSISLPTLNKICMFLSVEPKDFFVFSPYDLRFSCEMENKGNDNLSLNTKVTHNNSIYTLVNVIYIVKNDDISFQRRTFDVVFKDESKNKNWSITYILNSLDMMFKKIYTDKIQNEVEKLASDIVTTNLDKTNEKYTCNYIFPWASYPKEYTY